MKIKLFSYLNNIEEIITTLFLVIMCIFVFLQLLYRYLLSNPLLYAEEIARYAYIWATFIGLSLSTKTKEHIRIDFFVEKMPLKIKRLVNILMSFVTLALLVFLSYWGMRLVDFNKVMLSPALRMPLYIVYISFPLGTTLASIRTIKIIFKDVLVLLNKKTTSEYGE